MGRTDALNCSEHPYRAICFPLYGIPRVRHRDYIRCERLQLGYLNLLEKLNCAYCDYANGLIAMVREVAARTEQYWCPIKHVEHMRATHSRFSRFTDYGDGEGWRQRLPQIRCDYGDGIDEVGEGGSKR